MILLQGALPICQTSFEFMGKGFRKRGLKTDSNILTDILNKDPEQPVGNVFKTRFSQAKGYLEGKIDKMTGSGLALKRKRRTKILSLKVNVGR